MKVLVATDNIEVLAAALGQHSPEEIWWWANEADRRKGYALGLLKSRIIANTSFSREKAIDLGWDKVMKALPHSFTPKVDEEE
tara:strand:- start:436 stop:684 length:249 start_codon:yes stop_codon:yes gene_type:complete